MVNLGVFLPLNLPRTAGESNTVISRIILTKVSCWSEKWVVDIITHAIESLKIYSANYPMVLRPELARTMQRMVRSSSELVKLLPAPGVPGLLPCAHEPTDPLVAAPRSAYACARLW